MAFFVIENIIKTDVENEWKVMFGCNRPIKGYMDLSLYTREVGSMPL